MLTLIVSFNVVPFVTWIISKLHNINLGYFILIDDTILWALIQERQLAVILRFWIRSVKNDHDLAVNS